MELIYTFIKGLLIVIPIIILGLPILRIFILAGVGDDPKDKKFDSPIANWYFHKYPKQMIIVIVISISLFFIYLIGAAFT